MAVKSEFEDLGIIKEKLDVIDELKEDLDFKKHNM